MFQMKALKLFLLIFIAVLSSNKIEAQALKSFSNQHVQFIQELNDYLAASDKKTAKELMEQFNKSWASARINENVKNQIINGGNLMLKKRMTAFPNFAEYVRVVIAFENSDKSENIFEAWVSSLDKIVPKISTGKFLNYLSFTKHFFADNALYYSDAIVWSTTANQFEFGYDSLAYLKVGVGDIKCKSRSDSSLIIETQGILYPTENRFEGKGGKVLWVRTGLAEKEANAVLSKYLINVKSSKYSADSVKFTYSKYFNVPLLGTLEDKLSDNPSGRDPNYPRFSTYDASFAIPNIFKDVDYLGGISVRGAKLIGSGSGDARAELTFKRDGKPFLLAKSSNFLIEKNKVNSDVSAIKFFVEEDSIVHPGLNFKYMDDKREITLLRNNEGMSKTPYFNSFHQIDMDFEALYWKMEENTIRFASIPGAVEGKANFESSDYFRQERFMKIQGIDDINPLVKIKQLSDSRKSEVFSASQVASHFRIEITNVRHILRQLSYMGFITFDEETETVVLKDRLRKYLLAVTGKVDYDVIQFNSFVNGSNNNAILSLLNYDLRMEGVERIFLSDSQNVIIYPKDQQVLLKKNRDFEFDGRIRAGRFEFFGKKFDFEYERFKLNLNNVDSLRLYVQSNEMDERGRYKLLRVRTVIESVIGDLQIDHPTNKSGVKPLGNFPIFNSVKNSYAYYDKRSIHNGVYDRGRFYFQLDPFVVDSLNRFSNEGLSFEGTFVSADIFPDLRENLRLQPDYSLGFQRNTDPEGLPIYQNKGTFINNIDMSNKGLLGKGEIKYLTTTAKSDMFIFYPDSVNAFVKSLEVKAQTGDVEFPDVQATDVGLHWEPYKPDRFDISMKTTAMVMYEGEAKLRGKISIGEAGMSGSGAMDVMGAEFVSKKFLLKKADFNADTASFSLGSKESVAADGTREVAIKTDNIKARHSFEDRMAKLKSNSPDSYIEFPVNKYIAYMDELRWYMDKDEVDMNSSMNEIDLIGAKFVSTKADQDSLTFVAPKANYTLFDRTIRTEGVKLIRVADATIYPDKEKVNVERNAVITTLKNARVNANNDTKYHDIFEASIDILGRKRYKGTGVYEYEDELGKVQKITLNTIDIDSVGYTYALANIEEKQEFSLGTQFEFKGKAKLYAQDKHLEFDGATRIVHQCTKVNRSWLKFKAPIDPKNIMIPVDSFPKSFEGDKLTAGLVLIKDSTHVYPVFMSKKQKTGDQEIIVSRGFLKFDKGKQEYQLASKEKLMDRDLPGDYVSMHSANCDMYGEGEMSTGLDLGQVKVRMIGNVNHSNVKDETSFNVMIALDFFFNDDCLKLMTDAINGTSGLQAAETGGTEFKKNLITLLGKEAADKLLKEMASTGSSKKLPDELVKTIVFSKVELKWNTETRSYVSEGWLHISNIGKTSINRVVKGKIELVKKRGGDIINLYLEPDSENWFFFNYQRNIMTALGAKDNFNTILKELDSNKRQMKVESGQPPYQFMIGIEKRKRDFLTK